MFRLFQIPGLIVAMTDTIGLKRCEGHQKPDRNRRDSDDRPRRDSDDRPRRDSVYRLPSGFATLLQTVCSRGRQLLTALRLQERQGDEELGSGTNSTKRGRHGNIVKDREIGVIGRGGRGLASVSNISTLKRRRLGHGEGEGKDHHDSDNADKFDDREEAGLMDGDDGGHGDTDEDDGDIFAKSESTWHKLYSRISRLMNYLSVPISYSI